MHRDRSLAALCVVVAAGLAGCGSTALLSRTTSSSAGNIAVRLPPLPQLVPGDRQALVALGRADETVFKHQACSPLPRRVHRVPDYGSPSELMLSTFAVLKLPNKAAMPENGPGFVQRPFVNYIRVAQRRFGWPFKVIPVADFSLVPAHCYALEASAVRAAVAHAPTKTRTSALQIEEELQLDDQYIERHPEGICVSGYHGASLCESLLAAQARGGLSIGGPVVFCLVPNGVARITVRYPGSERGGPGRNVTVPVINNLAVWKLTSEVGDTRPTILWRAANGKVIRTVSASI